ncbi:MAG: hypothetical protein WA864_11715 [Acetobacteraceae bacterium]
MLEGLRAFLAALAISATVAVVVLITVGPPSGKNGQGAFSASETDRRGEVPQQPATERSPETQSERLTKAADKARRDNKDMNNTVAVATLVIGVIVAAIYAIQAYLMRETMIHTNRAYIHVGLWERHPLPDEHGTITRWRIAPQIANAGNTPTRNLVYSTANIISNAELAPGYRFPSVGDPRSTLVGPKQFFLSADIILTVEDLLRAKSHQVWFYTFGWIEYDDVFFFTSRHRTEFCYRIFPYGNPAEKDCDFGYLFHSDHNGADAECEHQRQKREKLPEPRPQRMEKHQISAGETTRA